MQYLSKAVLHRPRLNRLIFARYHINIAVILELPEQREQAIGNGDSSLGTFAFRRGDDELGVL